MVRTSITICSECFVYEKFAATHYLIKKEVMKTNRGGGRNKDQGVSAARIKFVSPVGRGCALCIMECNINLCLSN